MLYFVASEMGHKESFESCVQTQEKDEGIPIGKLFFWIQGAWEHSSGNLTEQMSSLYESLMGVKALGQTEELIGPFQNVEEVRRFAYLLCQRENFDEVFLLPMDDFNDSVKYCTSLEDLITRIHQKSDRLENLDVSKSRSLFERILTKKQ